MKVLVKFDSKLEVVENVSVDDKCMPIVGGMHPYPSASRDTSPLVRESALWFKTLALEAVYIDCNRRLIYWTPVVCDVNPQDVQMRTSPAATIGTNDFIPSTAYPLFKDNFVFDSDASLKEMMGKCCEVTRKFSRKSITADEYYKNIAKILHIYILPPITFTRTDMYCLSQAKSEIEKRLSKAEDNIRNKASVIDNLKSCLSKMESRLIHEENLDKESYLRTCKKDFLVAFLKTVESDLRTLNIELTAVQNRVNWAKEHPDDDHRLADFKERRDKIFIEIEERITVREAIKNVILRRDLTKKKGKKCQIINNCIHNMFIEIRRQLELEDLILLDLSNDKVNNCAAREAVLSVISNISNSNRDSDRATKFEPEKFVNYSVDEGKKIDKSDVWLTFQERVTKVLKDKMSVACICHEVGCQKLSSEIRYILREFELVRSDTFVQLHEKTCHEDEDHSCQFSLSLNEVEMRKPKLNMTKSSGRDAVLISMEGEPWRIYSQQPVAAGTQYSAESLAYDTSDMSTNTFNVNLQNSLDEDSDDDFRSDVSKPRLRRRTSLISMNDSLAEDYLLLPASEQAECGVVTVCSKKESPLKVQTFEKRQLTLSTWVNAIENLKGLIQAHFTEVIECLDQLLQRGENDETPFQEQQELLWKSYDRFFCQELYLQLLELYVAGLTPSIKKAYAMLSKTPLHEILKEDKLLDLFFGQKNSGSRAASILVPSQTGNQMSEVQAITPLRLNVQHCVLKDSYLQTNVNSGDLGCIDTSDDGAKASSCLSSQSVTLSIDEGFHTSSGSFSSSVQSVFSSDSLEVDLIDDLGKWEILSSPEKIDEILYPVLSPFRKFIRKCINATRFMDKVCYITRAIGSLNKEISQLFGAEFQSTCDDIISMLVLALCNIPEDMFVELYVNLRLLMDVFPSFFMGSLWDFNLVSLYSSYDYLFTLRMCEHLVKQ